MKLSTLIYDCMYGYASDFSTLRAQVYYNDLSKDFILRTLPSRFIYK